MPAGPTERQVAALFTEDCSKVNVEKSRVARGYDCRWEVIYTYKVYDDCGNYADDVVIKYNGWDQDAPVLAKRLPQGGKDMNLCFDEIPEGPTESEIAEYFTEDCGVVHVEKSGAPAGSDCRWEAVYTYKISDDCGNYAADVVIKYNGWDQDAPALKPDAVIPAGETDLNLCADNKPEGPTVREIAMLFDEDCSKVNVEKSTG